MAERANISSGSASAVGNEGGGGASTEIEQNGIKFKDTNDGKLVRTHSSQWLLCSGLMAASHKVGQFCQIAPHANHGARQEERTVSTINAMLGDPAELSSDRHEPRNLDLMSQRLFNMASEQKHDDAMADFRTDVGSGHGWTWQ